MQNHCCFPQAYTCVIHDKAHWFFQLIKLQVELELAWFVSHLQVLYMELQAGL